MVHDLLRNFTMYHNVLQVFHDVLLCLTMFSESCNDRHRRIVDRVAVDRLRDHDNAAGIGDNSAEIGNDAIARRDRRYRSKSNPMLNSVLNGDWSNSVTGREVPKGLPGYPRLLPHLAHPLQHGSTPHSVTKCPTVSSTAPHSGQSISPTTKPCLRFSLRVGIRTLEQDGCSKSTAIYLLIQNAHLIFTHLQRDLTLLLITQA